MSEARRTKLGDVIFSSIDDNDFLNVLYDNMLYNYAIGRVGRIKFNLYGNVFFISDGKHVTEKEFVRYLQEPIPDQKLSIVEELKPKLKKHVAETLLSGSARIEP